MMKKIGYSSLTLAILASIGTANAAGLDRSGQDVSAFLQDGTYAEVAYTYIDADVSGNGNGMPSGSSAETSYIKGTATGDIAESYDFLRYGVKTDVNDTFSIGVLYDEPFGAAVNHDPASASNFVTGDANTAIAALTANTRPIPNMATAQAAMGQLQSGIAQAQAQRNTVQGQIAQLQQGIAATTAQGGDTTTLRTQLAQAQVGLERINQGIAQATTQARSLGAAMNVAQAAAMQAGEPTNVEIRTQNLTGLLGMKFGANKGFQIYGGPAAQRLTGEVHLRGTAYQATSGYDASISPDTSVGWVAGVAYSKPEIALKAALTYRSEIEHDSYIAESIPATGYVGTQKFKVTLPESYNFDFQTGLSAKHRLLGTAKVRYVPWSGFDIRPTQYMNTVQAPIVSYADDQWSAELGLGKQISDKLSVAGTVGYDSGAGNPTTTLGPIDGYYSVGFGGKYNVTPNWSVSAGAKYLKFGNATANLPNSPLLQGRTTAGKFEDNDGYIVGVKLAYHAK